MIKNIKKLATIGTIGLGGIALSSSAILAINDNSPIVISRNLTRESLKTTTPNNKGLNITELRTGFSFIETGMNGSGLDSLPLSSSLSAQTVRTKTHLVNFKSNLTNTTAISINLETGDKKITVIPMFLIGSIITMEDFIIVVGADSIAPATVAPEIFIMSVAPVSGSIYIIEQIKIPVNVANNFDPDFQRFPISISPITKIDNSISIKKILIFQNGLSLEKIKLNTFIGVITNQGNLAIEHTMNLIDLDSSSSPENQVVAMNIIEGETSGTYNTIVFLKDGRTMSALHFNRVITSSTPFVKLISKDKLDTELGVNIVFENMLNLIPYARTEILNDTIQLLWILPSQNNSFIYSIEFDLSKDKNVGTLNTFNNERTINLIELGYLSVKQQYYGEGGTFESGNINISVKLEKSLGAEDIGVINWQNPTDPNKWSQNKFIDNILASKPVASLNGMLNPTILNFNENIIISGYSVGSVESNFKTSIARMRKTDLNKLDVSYNTRIPSVITLANGVQIPDDWSFDGSWVRKLITKTSNDLYGPSQVFADGSYFATSIREIRQIEPISNPSELNLEIDISSYWKNGIAMGQIAPPGVSTTFKVTIIAPTAESIANPIITNSSEVNMSTKASSFGQDIINQINATKIEGSFPPNWPGIEGIIGSSRNDLIQINQSYFPYLENVTFNANDFTGILNFSCFFRNGESIETVSISINGFEDLRIIIGSSIGAVVVVIGIIVALSIVLIKVRTKNKLSKALTAGFGLAQNFSASQETEKEVEFKDKNEESNPTPKVIKKPGPPNTIKPGITKKPGPPNTTKPGITKKPGPPNTARPPLSRKE